MNPTLIVFMYGKGQQLPAGVVGNRKDRRASSHGPPPFKKFDYIRWLHHLYERFTIRADDSLEGDNAV